MESTGFSNVKCSHRDIFERACRLYALSRSMATITVPELLLQAILAVHCARRYLREDILHLPLLEEDDESHIDFARYVRQSVKVEQKGVLEHKQGHDAIDYVTTADKTLQGIVTGLLEHFNDRGRGAGSGSEITQILPFTVVAEEAPLCREKPEDRALLQKIELAVEKCKTQYLPAALRLLGIEEEFGAVSIHFSFMGVVDDGDVEDAVAWAGTGNFCKSDCCLGEATRLIMFCYKIVRRFEDDRRELWRALQRGHSPQAWKQFPFLNRLATLVLRVSPSVVDDHVSLVALVEDLEKRFRQGSRYTVFAAPDLRVIDDIIKNALVSGKILPEAENRLFAAFLFSLAKLRSRLTFYLDPIDGTNAFIKGVPEAPMTLIGVVLDGCPVAAVASRLFIYDKSISEEDPTTGNCGGLAPYAGSVERLLDGCRKDHLLQQKTYSHPETFQRRLPLHSLSYCITRPRGSREMEKYISLLIVDGQLKRPIETRVAALRTLDALEDAGEAVKKVVLPILASSTDSDPKLCTIHRALCPAFIQRMQGAGNKMLALADGQAECCVTLPHSIKKWDTCVGHAMLESLGGSVRDFNGHEITYGGDTSQNDLSNGVVAMRTEVAYHLFTQRASKVLREYIESKL